jgi:hypothetical protein
VFRALPLAALIDGCILCFHGGLWPALRTLEDIAGLPRANTTLGNNAPDTGQEDLVSLMWGDPGTADELKDGNSEVRGSCSPTSALFMFCCSTLISPLLRAAPDGFSAKHSRSAL